jgi:hypothetical protein
MGFLKKNKRPKNSKRKKKTQKRQSISAWNCYFFQETRG